MFDIKNDIPEKDKTCLNCEHWLDQGEGDSDTLCHGTMPCLNYHSDNTENFFVPSDEYLEWKYNCISCRYDPSEPDEICKQCKNFYDNMWERQED